VNEDDLDYSYELNRKNMFIILMLVLVLMFFYMAYTQKIEDIKWCDMRMNATVYRNLTLRI
jgi:type III secretory pathway component EscU